MSASDGQTYDGFAETTGTLVGFYDAAVSDHAPAAIDQETLLYPVDEKDLTVEMTAPVNMNSGTGSICPLLESGRMSEFAERTLLLLLLMCSYVDL